MKKKIWRLAITTVIMTGMAACNTGTDTAKGDDTLNKMDKTHVDIDTIGRMKNTDAEWLSEVLENNYAEIKMSEQAQQKVSASDVKSLAKTLEKDHKMLVTEAKDMAAQKNWTVATQETKDARKNMEDMADEDMKEYEKDWLKMMEDKHEKSIRKFENANVDDADLKTWIANTLPRLRAHHDKIKQVQKNRK